MMTSLRVLFVAFGFFTLGHAAVYEPINAFRLGPAVPDRATLVRFTDGFDYGTTPENGPSDAGTIYRVGAAGQVEMVYAFPFSSTNPYEPRPGLLPDGSGKLWGAARGGDFTSGSIFKFDPATKQLTHVFIFPTTGEKGKRPTGELINDGAGFFWGTTESGGTNGTGTIFKIEISTGTLTAVASFATGVAGAKSELVAGSTGFLWGTTFSGGANNLGTIFKFEIATNILSTVVDFAGAGVGVRGQHPIGGLTSDGLGSLWGSTSGKGSFSGITDAGTIFKISTTSGILETKVEFTGPTGAHRGAFPMATLVNDGVSMIGTTTRAVVTSPADAETFGTIFKVTIANGDHTTSVDFTDDSGAVLGSDPLARLESVGVNLYRGTTSGGGSSQKGTVFEFNSATSAFSTVANFIGTDGPATGANPEGTLAADDAGNLWGVTPKFGRNAAGTVFKINLATSALETVIDFPNNAGAPAGGLVRVGNFLWGTTTTGATADDGTIFKIDLANSTLSTVAEFGVNAVAGSFPNGELLSDGAGVLWGVTQSDGGNGFGTVFKIDTTSGTVTTVALLTGTGGLKKGSYPVGGLARDGAGNFWGTTTKGGGSDLGTVFKIDPTTLDFTTVAEFTGTSGAAKGSGPEGPLLFDAGFIWGTTRLGGGTIQHGTIFKINVATNAFTPVVELTGSGGAKPGSKPLSGLLNDGTGKLWGTTSQGGFGFGTVFNLTAGAYAAPFTFGLPLAGLTPGHGRLYLHTDGNLYGTTEEGGVDAAGARVGGGQIFRIRLVAPLVAADVIAVKGGAVPGEPVSPATTYSALGISETGPFAGTLQPGTTKVAAIFAGDGSVRVRVGGSTPDLPTATLAKLGAPSGDAALASLKPLTGVVTAKDDTVLLAGLTSGPVRIAAREGFAHNGLAGGITLKTIGAFDGTGGANTPIFFLATLQGGDVTPKSDSALCVALANGDVHVLVREGQSVGGQAVTGIASLVGVKGSLAEGRWRAGASAIGARLTLADKSQGLFTIPSSATDPAQWTTWVNSAATLGAPLTGAKFASLGLPGFGDTGPAVMAKLKAAPPTFTAKNDTTLLRDEAAGLVLLGRESETAPVGGSFTAFSDPVSGASGRTAFLGTAAYGTPAKKLAGLWYSADGDTLALLARAGDTAPGGGKWAKLQSCVLPDASGPLFTATLATDKTAGISASNNFGLWGANAAGTPRLLLRTGDRVLVGAVELTVKSFVALTPAAGSIGAAHGYDENGHAAVLATFTDKTVALLELAAP